ncbi:hypothetical protein WMY93_019023 [Mugilogobius chulae]|uniref:RING-type domain-containing protein n=1 Tax=Mugilogobius chulae TaxID=88201 RepID=A0AAW0NCY7_9GOBI
MSPRIQRLMMKMQRYDFELIYTPGKHLVLADALSRAPAGGSISTTDEDIESHINFVSNALPVSDTKSRQIAEVTSQDTELQRVIQNMDEGWPAGSCPHFYHVRGELSFVDGLLLMKGRIVIPQALRPDVLARIHEGHLGIEKYSEDLWKMAEAQVSFYLTCAICKTFTEPVSLSCHHSFCRSCLQEHWAQQKIRICPVCKRKVSKDHPDIYFALKQLSDSSRQNLNVPQASAQMEKSRESKGSKGGKERKEEKTQDLQSLLQSLKEQRNQVRDRVNLYENIVQHSEKQAVQCERQITAVFERMRRHLQEEQDRAVSALRQEQSRQAQTMGPQLQSLRKTLSSLNNSIQELEKQLQTHSQDFLRTYRPALPPALSHCHRPPQDCS